MAEIFSGNPQFVDRGFICSRISLALDGISFWENSSDEDDYKDDVSGEETSDEEEISGGEQVSDEARWE